MDFGRFVASSRAEWRGWLAQQHASVPGIWLVTFKKGHPDYLAYGETVEEALCFGWIDSRPNTVDSVQVMRMFTPRRAGSAWSRLNKQRVEALLRDGLMTPSGLALVAAAQRDGSWSALDEVENLQMPADLTQEFAADPAARTNFEAFPPGARKIILGWIQSAKRAETRRERIRKSVSLAARNLRANLFRKRACSA